MIIDHILLAEYKLLKYLAHKWNNWNCHCIWQCYDHCATEDLMNLAFEPQTDIIFLAEPRLELRTSRQSPVGVLIVTV